MNKKNEIDKLGLKLIKYLTKHQMTVEGAIRILGRSMSSKTVLFGSDFHNGSINALCSPNPEREDGLVIIPTSQQKALWQIFEKIPDKLTKKPVLFVVNGEPIDGGNRRSGGRGAWTTHYGDQITDFAKCIKIIPYDHMLLTRGSPYHVDIDGTNFEEITANQLKTDNYRAFGGSGKTDYQVNFEINGKVFNATHHVGYSRWWQYRTTPLAVEMVKMHFDHAKRKFHTDVMVRSHVHYYAEARFLNTMIFSTPAWKLPDPFMYKSGLPTMPDIGMVECVIESNGHIDINPIVEDVDITPMVKHY
tara:strand:+ start:5695 stop:6606 length:912 start_codon:yes stop_codon:yes gene_type:complete